MIDIKNIERMINKKILTDLSKFETERSFIKQKFKEIKRESIKTYSVSVKIDSNIKEKRKDEDGFEYEFKELSKDKVKKTVKSLNAQVMKAFKAIDTNEADFDYVIVDTSNEEFRELNRVQNTNIFYSVTSQDLLSYHIEDEYNQISTPEQVAEKLKELSEDDSAKLEKGKNGIFFINFFMFVRSVEKN